MAVKFNPFSGQLQIDEKGASASYIDGEVATYADLPLDGTAPLNTAWLVRGSSGVWPFTKPGGVYVRTATGGSSRDADYTYAGIFPDVFSDANFTLYDDSDTSKNAKFQLSGISTGTTRTLTVPDGSGTIQLALVRSSSSMSGNVSLSAGRARHITYTLLGGSYQVTLPLTGNQSGDVCRFTNSTSSSSGAILTVARGNGSGGVVIITTLERNQTVTCFNRDGTETGWTLEGVDTHTHAAADVTSGVFDNARINFAAPSAIGSTTAAAITGTTGTFTTLSANNGTITASAPVLDLAQTWNNAAVAFTGMRVNVTDTASAAASVLASIQTGGVRQLAVTKTGNIQFKDNAGGGLTTNPVIFDFGSNQYWCHLRFAGSDLFTFQQNNVLSLSGGQLQISTSSVARESGKGILEFNTGSTATDDSIILSGRTTFTSTNCAIRNGTNAQTFRIYNTFTDASNYERGFIGWSSNTLRIGTEKAGTGSARALEFQTDGTTRASVTTGGNFWVNNQLILGTTVLARITSPADGVVTLFDSGQATFNRLQFGGTTSSFPALKRSSTTLQVRLADDSADAPLSCGALTVSGNITHTSSLTLASTSTGNIIFSTNATTRWQIGGSSGALVSENGIPIRFGGSTSSFPRLVNSGAVLQCGLADGSGSAVFEAQLRAQGTAPATSGATGTAGDIRYDADYIYVCTAANTWKRAAIATW